MLNKHCPFCEFHQRCHAEAIAQDDLSLLRGLSAKEITRYHKHGIFTVTQLSPPSGRGNGGSRSHRSPRCIKLPYRPLAIRDQENPCIWHPTTASRFHPDLL